MNTTSQPPTAASIGLDYLIESGAESAEIGEDGVRLDLFFKNYLVITRVESIEDFTDETLTGLTAASIGLDYLIESGAESVEIGEDGVRVDLYFKNYFVALRVEVIENLT